MSGIPLPPAVSLFEQTSLNAANWLSWQLVRAHLTIAHLERHLRKTKRKTATQHRELKRLRVLLQEGATAFWENPLRCSNCGKAHLLHRIGDDACLMPARLSAVTTVMTYALARRRFGRG